MRFGRYLGSESPRVVKDTSLGRWRSGVQIPATPPSFFSRKKQFFGGFLLELSLIHEDCFANVK